MADALYATCEFSDVWTSTLAANLCIASLLCSAAEIAVEKERQEQEKWTARSRKWTE